MTTPVLEDLPGLNCGLCGFRSCAAMAEHLAEDPSLLERCIPRATGYAAAGRARSRPISQSAAPREAIWASASDAYSPSCVSCPAAPQATNAAALATGPEGQWHDTLGREFDFYLEHFPDDPGPREIILPHNPLLTRELNIQVGDVLIGRPLGMSCGCPITHCGVAMQVDHRTGVMTWCVTGPLRPRQEGYKDLGYYVAEGYEGLIVQARCEIAIGRRYFFQPRMCMLQWRHSGLVNFLNRTSTGLSVRVEGLWIG